MIRLQSLQLSRFRGICEGTLEGLADVSLLVGRNNSGKTTVLEAILRLFLQNRGDQDALQRTLQQIGNELRAETEVMPPSLWYRQDLTQNISVRGKVGDSRVSREKDATVSLTIGADRAIHPSQSFVEGGINEATLVHFLRNLTLFRASDTYRNIEYQYWSRLLATRRDKVLTKALNDIFNLQAEACQLLPDNRLMILFEDYGLPLDLQGDGTRAAFRTMIALALIQQGVLLLEEPECHQHPGSLERFARALCSLAVEQEVQLIISTHSAECVRAFLKGSQSAGSEGAVFHLTLEKGKQTCRRLGSEAVETLQSTGVDVRFLDLYG